MYEHGKTHLQPVSLFKDSSPAERFDGRMEGSEMRCNGKTNAENPGKRSSSGESTRVDCGARGGVFVFFKQRHGFLQLSPGFQDHCLATGRESTPFHGADRAEALQLQGIGR